MSQAQPKVVTTQPSHSSNGRSPSGSERLGLPPLVTSLFARGNSDSEAILRRCQGAGSVGGVRARRTSRTGKIDYGPSRRVRSGHPEIATSPVGLMKIGRVPKHEPEPLGIARLGKSLQPQPSAIDSE